MRGENLHEDNVRINCAAVLYSTGTMLFVLLGSFGSENRLAKENARIISAKTFGGAASARSTRLYAMAASTSGPADRTRCNNMETVNFVTCENGGRKNELTKGIRIANHLPLHLQTRALAVLRLISCSSRLTSAGLRQTPSVQSPRS